MSIILASILIGLGAISLSVAVIVWRTLALVEYLDRADRPPPPPLPPLPPENPIDAARRALVAQAQNIEAAALSMDMQGHHTDARDRWAEAREIREKILRA